MRALRSNLDYRVEYLDEKVRDAERVVSTEVSAVRNGRTHVISIDYVLKQRGGAWRAVDVVTSSSLPISSAVAPETRRNFIIVS